MASHPDLRRVSRAARRVSGGDSPSVVLNWIVLGTSDDLLVKALVRATTPAIYDGLVLQTVAVKETAPEAWDCQAKYGVRKPPKEYEYKFAFDTTGGKQKITQAYETIASYAQPARRPATTRARSV